MALGGISEWFDDYIAGEEADPGEEPELHKGMVLLLARCWEYRLKTEDVLELCQGNRRIALCTVSRGGFERSHWFCGLWRILLTCLAGLLLIMWHLLGTAPRSADLCCRALPCVLSLGMIRRWWGF